MTESEWLKSKDGEAMLAVVADRLTPRKWALLACSVVRRVLHLLPVEPFHEAVEFAERNQVTEENSAVWQQRVIAAEPGTRDAAWERQRQAVKECEPDADPGQLPDDDDDDGNPVVRVFAAASHNAAGSMAAAAGAVAAASRAVSRLFSSEGAGRLEGVRETVSESQVSAAEASVLAFVAFDLLRKAERFSETKSSRRRNLQFSIAANIVEEAEDDVDRKYERASHEKRAAENTALAHLLREQFGNPFRPNTFDARWRTETALALATGIETDRAFDRMPVLADALEEAGCDWSELLAHLRGPGPHMYGCWALDLVLDREPELFSQPPLVPTPRSP